MQKLHDRQFYFDALLKFKNLLDLYDNEFGIRTNKDVKLLLNCILEENQNLDSFIEAPELMRFKTLKNEKGKKYKIVVDNQDIIR